MRSPLVPFALRLSKGFFSSLLACGTANTLHNHWQQMSLSRRPTHGVFRVASNCLVFQWVCA